VSRLLVLPSCEALEVERTGGAGSLLVPMVKDAVRGIDAGQRRIEVNLDFLADALAPGAPARRGRGGDGGD
jgi:ribosomal 30S subunit maturation factor RimM